MALHKKRIAEILDQFQSGCLTITFHQGTSTKSVVLSAGEMTDISDEFFMGVSTTTSSSSSSSSSSASAGAAASSSPVQLCWIPLPARRSKANVVSEADNVELHEVALRCLLRSESNVTPLAD